MSEPKTERCVNCGGKGWQYFARHSGPFVAATDAVGRVLLTAGRRQLIPIGCRVCGQDNSRDVPVVELGPQS